MAISLIPSGRKIQGSGKFTLPNLIDLAGSLIPSVVVFVVVGALYLGSVLWINQLEAEAQNIKIQKEEIVLLSRQQEVSELKNFAGKVRVLNQIIRDHNIPSNLFNPFEESVHGNVVITTFALDVPLSTLDISGITQSIETLGEQFIIWKTNTEYIESVDLIGFEKNSEGQVSFSMELKVKREFLKATQ